MCACAHTYSRQWKMCTPSYGTYTVDSLSVIGTSCCCDSTQSISQSKIQSIDHYSPPKTCRDRWVDLSTWKITTSSTSPISLRAPPRTTTESSRIISKFHGTSPSVPHIWCWIISSNTTTTRWGFTRSGANCNPMPTTMGIWRSATWNIAWKCATYVIIIPRVRFMCCRRSRRRISTISGRTFGRRIYRNLSCWRTRPDEKHHRRLWIIGRTKARCCIRISRYRLYRFTCARGISQGISSLRISPRTKRKPWPSSISSNGPSTEMTIWRRRAIFYFISCNFVENFGLRFPRKERRYWSKVTKWRMSQAVSRCSIRFWTVWWMGSGKLTSRLIWSTSGTNVQIWFPIFWITRSCSMRWALTFCRSAMARTIRTASIASRNMSCICFLLVMLRWERLSLGEVRLRLSGLWCDYWFYSWNGRTGTDTCGNWLRWLLAIIHGDPIFM